MAGSPCARHGGVHAISVRDLRKSYGDTPAVRGISFDVAPGEVFGLLGANGAAKITTIWAIAGIAVAAARHFRRGPIS
jgi:ABC-2 type transport system ATP-binding protein